MIQRYAYSILNAIDEAICISDAEGTVVYVNTAWEHLTHLPKEEVLGRNVDHLLRAGYVDTILAPKVLETRTMVTTTQTLNYGKKLLLQGYPILENDELKFVVTLLKDKTKITELKEQLDILKSMQDKSKPAPKRKPVVLSSPLIKKIFRQLNTISDTDATVLITGETGVGKDIFAQKAHHSSNRSDQPFIKVDCGALPENLIESELFGYAPGSFSGAKKQGKKGLIESADGGTVFLDEIGELPLLLQTRLLRVLQDKEIQRVGETITRPVDVRFIAATNQNIPEYIEQGRFRADLYYRLKIVEINIPPLRKRRIDILPLLNNYLDYYCRLYDRKVSFCAEAEQSLIDYHWPGNVRELENFVLKSVVESDKPKIYNKDLPAKIRNTQKDEIFNDFNELCSGKSLKEISDTVEMRVLANGLKKHCSISDLARHLKTERSTISRKLKKYRLAN